MITILTQVCWAETEASNSEYTIMVNPKYVIELAQKMSEKIAVDSGIANKSVAIIDFDLIPERDDQKIDMAVARNVREDLSTAMGEVKGIRLVERGQMNAALASLKLDQSGIIDLESAKKLGKMLSADYVLCGSVSDRSVFVVINARMIDTQTGEVKYPVWVDFNK
ncbi:MAG: FlgO family outer membrane protein [Armatimonadota bacterium]